MCIQWKVPFCSVFHFYTVYLSCGSGRWNKPLSASFSLQNCLPCPRVGSCPELSRRQKSTFCFSISYFLLFYSPFHMFGFTCKNSERPDKCPSLFSVPGWIFKSVWISPSSSFIYFPSMISSAIENISSAPAVPVMSTRLYA